MSKTVCNCIAEVNAKLAERNTKLTESIVISGGTMDLCLLICTEVVEKKRGAKALLVQPSHCPFCGERYRDPDGEQTPDELRKILGIDPDLPLTTIDDETIQTCAGTWVKQESGNWLFEKDEDDEE